MQLMCKIWLDHNGKAFGKGPYELLQRVEQTGSLSRAAAGMGMSYNKAWRLVRMLEERLGFALLECRKGGDSGGGSEVTPRARQLMQRYRDMGEELNAFVRQLNAKYFAD
ncbi:MAG: LysR family transcriptional regulator [Firmicutes bacterium]|nr:LysR family transcriptional regulator [Bacillota bacterium]